MARGRKAAHPTEARGRDARGANRPADDRFLLDAQLDERDAYLLEVTGPQAQQLVAKRGTLRAALDRLADVDLDQLASLAPGDVDLGDEDLTREQLLDALADQANAMPWETYREFLADLDDMAVTEDDLDEDPTP